ncbi:MAG: hypothetical protein PHG03_01755 [Bacilli bacterium]|nr:hypothetical protein [Bacilli bacterium]MDD4795270.1 hypothetical protein [Bacilli bacterium]
MKQKKDILILVSGLLIILLVIIGVSYAYFTANITGGDESTTIEVKGGRMTIIYDGGDDIDITNILPSNNPVAIKRFTVTGFNNTKVPMAYKMSLVVEKNDFSSEALKYKLISENTDNNGLVLPSITTLTKIPSGASTIELGTGSFEVPTDGNKTHTYDLEIYFPNEDYDQNIEQDKQIAAYILTENYNPPPLLSDLILAQGGGAEAIEAKGKPLFSVINGISGIYADSDEYGTSYYYRGIKDELNNNLIWGGFQWKIVRINGDGSIRLIYNGTEAQFTTNGVVNDGSTDTQIGTSAFNTTNNDDAKYVGYMYGGLNGVASTQRDGTVSKAATYNETSPEIKNIIDNWYSTNISGKEIENNIVDNLFCNDRQSSTGTGYGKSATDYQGLVRLNTQKNPTLKCGIKNDCFTVADTVIGNGNLTYPVGLITADEASMAGLVRSLGGENNYLLTDEGFWTMTPYQMYSSGSSYANIYLISGALALHTAEMIRGVRPVVSIFADARVQGTGTASDPFVAS